MKRWFDFAWRWSFVATLPIALLFVWWAVGTFAQWKRFTLDYDASPATVSLRDLGIDRWRNMVRHGELTASPGTLASVPEDRALRTVQLFVGESALRKLNSDLPYSGFEFVDGKLVFPDGHMHEVSVRYRGDFLVHWGYEKKSIRVRTKDHELFEGMQQFNLIVPKYTEQVNNYLGYKLADELGLMAPRCELVNVTMNGQNLGLHEFTEQLDENTLRRHDHAVGEIFTGELIAKDEVHGVTNRVFELPQLWEQLVDVKHLQPGGRAPLEALLRLLADTPSEQNQARLSELLDMRAFGAFGAFELLTQTHHYDEYHNWRLAWDPWTQRFQPIVWDAIPWIAELRVPDDGPVALDLVVSRLAMWMHRNGDFLAERHRVLREFFTSGHADEFAAEVDATLTKAKDALALDPNVRPTDPQVVADGMQSFRAFVDRTFKELRVAYAEPTGSVRHAPLQPDGTIALEVTGRQPVDELVLRFHDPVHRPTGATLRWYRDGKAVDVDLSGGLVVQDNTLRVPTRLLSQLQPQFRFLPGQPLRQHALQELPGYYELRVPGLDAPRLAEVVAVRGTTRQRATPVSELQASELTWLYRATQAQPSRVPQVWRGTVAIADVQEVRDDVVIEPGTTIELAPGAALVFRGRIDAVGQPEHPIRFLPSAPGQGPWGTIALVGDRAGGSTFQHCEFRGGSGSTIGMARYPAMFAVHGATEVRVADCRFADSFREDDMVHLAHASVRFDRDEWRHAPGDALACELSRVELDGCRFKDTRGDGIELRATAAVLRSCQFEDHAGSGILADESSAVVAVQAQLRRCGTGVTARDGAIVRLANCELRDNTRPATAAHKNWRFERGGDLTITKSVLVGAKELPESDRRSHLLVLDCQVALGDKLDWHVLTPDNRAQFIDCDGGTGPKHRRPVVFPPELVDLEPMARAAWDTVRTDVRGGVRDQ